MAPPSRLAQLQAAARRASANMGRVMPGDPIPAPRPAPLGGPPPTYTVIFDAPPPPRTLSDEAVEAVMRKVQAEGIESLSPELRAALEATPAYKQAVADIGDLSSDAAGGTLDNLDSSAMPITADEVDAPNTTPNTARTNPLDLLASRIRQATTRQDSEPLAYIRNLQAEVDALPDADRAALLAHPELAAGIESEGAVRDPAKRAQAMAAAQDRLDALRQLADVSTEDRAAEQIVNAAAARQVAGTPREAPMRQRTADAFEAAQLRALEAIPEDGNWQTVLDAYSQLSPERRRAALEAMPDEAGKFVDDMLDPNSDDFSVLPNNVARVLGPLTEPDGSVNPIYALVEQLDAAKRAGDKASYDDILLDIQTHPDVVARARALPEFIQRSQAREALRRAIVGTDPEVVEARRLMLANALPPAPAPNITPGVRSLTVAPGDIPAAELPKQADVANAVERERLARLDKQTPMGGVSAERRKQAFSIPPDGDLRDVPMAFRGADRADPFETRPIRERLPDTTDLEAVEKARALQAEIDKAVAAEREATYELRLAQIGRFGRNPSATEADVKAATQKLLAAREAAAAVRQIEDELFPPRLVNPRTGEVRDLTKTGEVPKGFYVERGYKAKPDSVLNRPSIQDTYDHLIMTKAGFRPKAQASLDRANPNLSAAQRQIMEDDIVRQYGEADTADLLPDEVGEGAAESGGRGRRGRLGGGQQQSRVQAAQWNLYFDPNTQQLLNNPFALVDADGNPITPDAAALAKEELSKQTIFKPGTAGYDMAREAIERINRETFDPSVYSRPNPYGVADVPAAPHREVPPPGVGSVLDPDRLPAMQGEWPEGTMRQTASQPPWRNENLFDLPDPPATPKRDWSAPATPEEDVDLTSFPSRGARQNPQVLPEPDDAGVSARLAASATNLSDTTPADAVDAPAAPRRRTKQDVDAEMEQFYQDARDAYADSGMTAEEIEAEIAPKVAARRKLLESQLSETSGEVTGATDAAPAAGDGKGGKKRGGGKRSTGKKSKPEQGDGAASQAEGTAPPSDPAAAADELKPVSDPAAPAGTAPETPAGGPDGSGPTPTPAPPTPQTSAMGRLLQRAKTAARWSVVPAVAGTAYWLTTPPDTPAGGDVPLPPGFSGGGGAGGGGGGVYVTAPTGTGSAMLDDAAAQEAAIQRALDRIRGVRAPAAERRATQTLMNY